MRDTSSLLLPADKNCRNVAPPDGHHRYSSSANLDLANPNLQPEVEGGIPATATQGAPQPLGQTWAPEQGTGPTLAEQRAATPSPTEDEVRVSFFSDSSSDGVAPTEPLSPHSLHVSPRATAPRASSPASPLAADSDEHQSPSPGWADGVSPEERILMTNSANFARDRRRRRGAVQFEVSPLEPTFPSQPSPISAPSPPPPQDRHHGSEGSSSPATARSATRRATPRGRLQRSFVPSERECAGVLLTPGLLRRLGRPFSGPWQGPSSPLISVSLAATPPDSRLSRLRDLFQRRR
ncbi:hypothetical protein AUEXF2481DRAFT_585628 [Aureobasidium subglaciale EXF-2481]|uniref:Uncharacterized protein n=1 Tax=Aureobasidium subglaciale (strain EXF-2481) TaxID=1043005 RepID=A0A074YHH4_AURSE|nr:uncharacterized protein AUEXF2481DRAFT_585628 [Aureobasidium subglaciale EXF-2481]KAI5205875.1 hypothetical protein E4T38_03982 [Aureobasidium subglaciale]KAI5224843.1 hypothetical protein E4T40_03757 [Aureobasidium subglaciale]KAI5227947.1 hypothetical protein E4T41_03977 [Aureobasidium subglaciale]KAI5263502.1 hypothetical protein E4T46_03598 [Aureobasidium subglaciale]KEQ97263.1 hypothetical protein AUEXF2481DRAFT_585628 [Aureobasidium subglaciale EXF-2481]